jgi:hypothetical protein
MIKIRATGTRVYYYDFTLEIDDKELEADEAYELVSEYYFKVNPPPINIDEFDIAGIEVQYPDEDRLDDEVIK